eukprot:COSAG02_NODE_4038_length_5874_cov_2.627661_6_plen_144_part_00
MDSVYSHSVLHNDPVVAAQLRETRNAISSIHGQQQGRGIVDTIRGLTGNSRIDDDQREQIRSKLQDLQIGSDLQSHDPLQGVRRMGTSMLMETLGGSGMNYHAFCKSTRGYTQLGDTVHQGTDTHATSSGCTPRTGCTDARTP